MIITLDAGSTKNVGSIIVEAWKHGVEVERLTDNQLELTCGRDDKLESLISKFPSIKILHKELIKEVGIYG